MSKFASKDEYYLSKIRELQAKLKAVEHKLGQYMATDDPVAWSYAVQLRRVINEARADE